MTALTHQWNHRYTTPIRGQALKAARPGYHIALAIGEIQDTITAIKAANDETPHQWVARFPIPHNLQTISRNRPGTYISLSLGEIQSVVDGMTGISQGDKLPTSLFASYSEHRQVLGQSGYTPDEEIVEPAAYQWTHRYPKPSTGEVIHIARPGLNIAQVITEIQNRLSALPPSDDSSSAIEEMQTWLETNCTSFIDNTSGPLNPVGDAFLYYTLDSWRTAAGIEDRPLNIEELQAGFNALKWTHKTVLFSGLLNKYSNVRYGADLADAKSIATTYYTSDPPSAIGSIQSNSWMQYTYGYHAALLYRSYGLVSAGFAGVARSADLYFLATEIGGDSSIYDTLSDFAAPQDVFTVVHTFPLSSDATFSFNVGNATAPPWGTDPVQSGSNSSTLGYKVTKTGLVCKWSFTTA